MRTIVGFSCNHSFEDHCNPRYCGSGVAHLYRIFEDGYRPCGRYKEESKPTLLAPGPEILARSASGSEIPRAVRTFLTWLDQVGIGDYRVLYARAGMVVTRLVDNPAYGKRPGEPRRRRVEAIHVADIVAVQGAGWRARWDDGLSVYAVAPARGVDNLVTLKTWLLSPAYPVPMR